VPGWITAIAIFGLLIGAIVTAVYAAKASGKQSQERRHPPEAERTRGGRTP
jgi:hypothetical protein